MRTRTGYSFRTAYGHIDDVINVLKENGETAAPMSDRMSTFGFKRWEKAAGKAGLRPIYGVELACVQSLGEKKPTIDYWTFWATNSIRELHEAIGLATDNPGKEPSLTYEQAMSFKGLIKIAGERTQRAALSHHRKDKRLYLSLSPSSPIGLLRKAVIEGFKLVAQSDNYFPRPEDKETYRVALGWRANNQTYPQFIIGKGELHTYLEKIMKIDQIIVKDAFRNRDKIIKECTAVLQKATLLTPKKPKSLRQMCLDGSKILKCDLKNKIYKERLDKELKLIADKNFEDYFYIIADMIAWAKQRMIVGPARGSSCGSLVCYLIGITTIDPIPYGLIFERFIDINRSDLPDIDIDFSDSKRELVFEYAQKKYGTDHVARLGTIGLFKPKSAIKQAASQLDIPPWEVTKLTDTIIDRSGGDSRALQALEDAFKDTDIGISLLQKHPELIISAKLEGHPNNASQHAAGIVITEKPIIEYVAVDRRTRAIMCDKKDAEDYNLLKIDALGLTQLSIFERTLELIGEQPTNAFLERIPLNDKMAFRVLNDGKFSGIFQFAGSALQSLTKGITVEYLEDIVSITALARPGPLATGGSQTWINRRTGKEKVTYLHPMMEKVTKATYGVVIYQETVMEIMRTIGLMSWEDTSTIRKSMSKSLGDEFFEKYWIKFKEGAIKNKFDAGTAREIWDQVNKFGSWAFNRSHSVAYGIVSYWCCWFKAHHPVEFAAATLDAETDPLRQIQMLRELEDEGIKYIPVDPDHSIDKWTVATKKGKKYLIGPLTQIKGFGPAAVSEILLARKEGKELRPAQRKKLQAAKTEIDSLYPIRDRIKALHPDLTEINIYSEPINIKDVQPGFEGDVMIMAVVKRIAPLDENEDQRVTKRGYKLKGPVKALNLFFIDDTDEIFCKINRYDYERMAIQVLERGRPGKSIYAVKGTVPKDFRMISIKAIRYLGDLSEDQDIQSLSQPKKIEEDAGASVE